MLASGGRKREGDACALVRGRFSPRLAPRRPACGPSPCQPFFTWTPPTQGSGPLEDSARHLPLIITEQRSGAQGGSRDIIRHGHLGVSSLLEGGGLAEALGPPRPDKQLEGRVGGSVSCRRRGSLTCKLEAIVLPARTTGRS